MLENVTKIRVLALNNSMQRTVLRAAAEAVVMDCL